MPYSISEMPKKYSAFESSPCITLHSLKKFFVLFSYIRVKRIDEHQFYTDKIGIEVFKTEEQRKQERDGRRYHTD